MFLIHPAWLSFYLAYWIFSDLQGTHILQLPASRAQICVLPSETYSVLSPTVLAKYQGSFGSHSMFSPQMRYIFAHVASSPDIKAKNTWA